MFEREEDQPSETQDSTPETLDPSTPGAPGGEGEQEQEDAGSTSRPGASPQDPTAGMTPEQQLQHYQQRAKRFEAQWHKEREKTKAYRGGGIATYGKEQTRQPNENRQIPADVGQVDTVQDLYNYAEENITKKLRAEWIEEKLNDRFIQAEHTARQKYTGADPLYPDYDEMVDTYVKPLLDQQPVIKEMLRRSFDNPAEASYLFSHLLKYKNMENMREALLGEATDKVVKNINGAAKRGATVQGRGGGKQPVLGKVDYNSMPFEDFEAEIEKVKSGKA